MKEKKKQPPQLGKKQNASSQGSVSKTGKKRKQEHTKMLTESNTKKRTSSTVKKKEIRKCRNKKQQLVN